MPVKPFKSYEEQIALLESRGLQVPDHDLAREILKHHRSFTITVALPTSQPVSVLPALNRAPSANRLVYNSLVLLAHTVTIVSPNSDWRERLTTHLLTLNRPDHVEMGFPPSWQTLSFWN